MRVLLREVPRVITYRPPRGDPSCGGVIHRRPPRGGLPCEEISRGYPPRKGSLPRRDLALYLDQPDATHSMLLRLSSIASLEHSKMLGIQHLSRLDNRVMPISIDQARGYLQKYRSLPGLSLFTGPPWHAGTTAGAGLTLRLAPLPALIQQSQIASQESSTFPTVGFYTGTPRIMLEALKIAEAAVPTLRPRVSLLSLVIMVATEPPLGRLITTSVFTALSCTRVIVPQEITRQSGGPNNMSKYYFLHIISKNAHFRLLGFSKATLYKYFGSSIV